MKKAAMLGMIALLVHGTVSAAEVPAPAPSVATIVTHEEEKYFFTDGRVERFDGQYEYTYLVDPKAGIITRTRIYDWREKKITPDDTVYDIREELHSHPLTAARYGLTPVIRAIGRPEDDSVETLVIEDKWVQSAISTGNRLVLTRARRLK